MDITSNALLIALLFNAILGALMFAHGPKTKSNTAYALLIGSLIAWITTLFILRNSSDPHTQFVALAASYCTGTAIAASFWYFVMLFSRRTVTALQHVVILGCAIGVSILAWTSRSFIVGIISLGGGEYQLMLGRYYIFFILYFSLVMIAAFVRLIKTFFSSASSEQRSQLALVFWGTFLTTVIGSLMNIYLVEAGNAAFISWGPVSTVIMVSFITLAIARNHFMNIRVIGAEIFTLILVITLFIQALFATSPFFQLLNGLTFVIALVVGILLIRSVMIEVHQRERLQILSDQLQQTNSKLVQSDTLKSEFLSFASHQIKTPMTVVRGYSSLIADGSYGPAPAAIKDIAVKITESANRMIKLVDTFLDVRRIEEGRMGYSFKQADVNTLLSSVVDEMRQLATAKSLNLSLMLPSTHREVLMDTQYMRQVLQNIIDNAIKYTSEGSVTVVMRDDTPGMVAIDIIDTGRGIPATLIPKLFEQFSRDPAVSRLIAGTGLGLYVARQIVTAHNGTVTAMSAGPGRGSTFSLSLPTVTP